MRKRNAATFVTATTLSLIACAVLWPSGPAHAAQTLVRPAANEPLDISSYWFLVAAGIAFLIPAGLVLIGAAGLHPQRAWDAALGGLAAIGLASLGYWATGFALQFGGVGLFHTHPDLMGLVWEWSALPTDWGIGWGMAGLRGWFLSGLEITPAAYSLFLAHLPWAVTAALLPVLALRGRAPAMATLLLALLTGGLFYPLAGNWVQGGGWLAALGNNLELGHGLIDFGGAGSVFLVAAGLTLAALLVWLPRRAKRPISDPALPAVHLPLLAVVGALCLLAGILGWNWANPIQAAAVGDLAPLRGSVNSLLYAAGGVLVPLSYTWFVIGKSDPLMTARGLAAGVIAGLAAGPFVTPSAALVIGLLAGASVPFVTFVIDRVMRLNDTAGVISMAGIPALLGLLAVGILADGSLGSGWQNTGVGTYLGVSGQGVSGLLVAQGYQLDFPGQLQAQVIGGLALGLWGFLVGSLTCIPLAVFLQGLEAAAISPQASGRASSTMPQSAGTPSGQTVQNRPSEPRFGPSATGEGGGVESTLRQAPTD